MDIARTLSASDGKRVAPFRPVANALQDTPEQVLPQLLDLATGEEPALQIGATWVIKHLAERGNAPSGRLSARAIDLLGRLQAPRRGSAPAADAVSHGDPRRLARGAPPGFGSADRIQARLREGTVVEAVGRAWRPDRTDAAPSPALGQVGGRRSLIAREHVPSHHQLWPPYVFSCGVRRNSPGRGSLRRNDSPGPPAAAQAIAGLPHEGHERTKRRTAPLPRVVSTPPLRPASSRSAPPPTSRSAQAGSATRPRPPSADARSAQLLHPGHASGGRGPGVSRLLPHAFEILHSRPQGQKRFSFSNTNNDLRLSSSRTKLAIAANAWTRRGELTQRNTRFVTTIG